jgi:hypothetical protein
MQCTCALLSSVACRLYNFFSIFLINGTIFEKKLLNIKCVFWFSLQLSSETFLFLRRTERDIIKNAYWSSCKVLVFYGTYVFWTHFRKILKHKFSWKFFQWKPSCFMQTDRRTEGQTDVTNLRVGFTILRMRLIVFASKAGKTRNIQNKGDNDCVRISQYVKMNCWFIQKAWGAHRMWWLRIMQRWINSGPSYDRRMTENSSTESEWEIVWIRQNKRTAKETLRFGSINGSLLSLEIWICTTSAHIQCVPNPHVGDMKSLLLWRLFSYVIRYCRS